MTKQIEDNNWKEELKFKYISTTDFGFQKPPEIEGDIGSLLTDIESLLKKAIDRAVEEALLLMPGDDISRNIMERDLTINVLYKEFGINTEEVKK